MSRLASSPFINVLRWWSPSGELAVHHIFLQVNGGKSSLMFFAPAADIITADILLPQTAALWAARFCSTLQKCFWPVRLTSTKCLLISYHKSACTAIRALCTDKLLNSSSSSWFESLISSVRSSWRYDAPLETWRQEHTFNFHSAHRYSVSAVPLDQYNSGQLRATHATHSTCTTNK